MTERSFIRTASVSDEPTLLALFLLFSKIGVTSFGGGISGWMMRDFVRKRGWITEEEFLSGLALTQAFPGINVVNLAIWVGYRLRGGSGALVAALGMTVPPILVAIAMMAIYSRISDSRGVPIAMAGIAAAAIGLSLEMGVHAARRASTNVLSMFIMLATFVAIFILKLNLIWVVLVAAPCSIGAAYYGLTRR